MNANPFSGNAEWFSQIQNSEGQGQEGQGRGKQEGTPVLAKTFHKLKYNIYKCNKFLFDMDITYIGYMCEQVFIDGPFGTPTREIFETFFARGYLVTDAIYLPGTNSRSFYVLIDGEAQLGF